MIKVDKLTKRFGSLAAVSSASFALEPGELVGFVGPNGAGKSTLLKMLSTFLYPMVCGGCEPYDWPGLVGTRSREKIADTIVWLSDFK